MWPLLAIWQTSFIVEFVNSSSSGRVASLHLHPREGGQPLSSVQSVEVVEAKGILDNPRYFGRVSKSSGQPSRRQVSLIEREQIAEHAATLGLQSIAPGAVRSNIETSGIDLVGLVGQEIQIGTAVLLLYAPRDPCEKMDAICQGLREQMMNNRQGVLAEVLRSGRIQVGDAIVPVGVPEAAPSQG
jgi:MOSC domain-containing protein YiiM